MGKVVYNPSRSDYGFTNENFTVDLDGNIYATSITLAENEAILIFSKNGKEYQQKITKVIEKPALEYPSAKPKF